MVRDLTGDQRHGTAPRADVKRRGPGPEGVLRHQRGITNSDRQPRFWVRSPHASVLYAESATARARRNLWRVSLPFDLEGDIAAVAFTGDEHVDIDASRAAMYLATRNLTGTYCHDTSLHSPNYKPVHEIEAVGLAVSWHLALIVERAPRALAI